jgi:dsDNA-specific endonuclease/ATPase MutS2
MNMSSGEILEQQLFVFNKALDNAIVHGLKEVTFIHGVGQGTLKNRILEEVRSRKEIKYWQDAQKSKFGYGATKIVL